MIEPCLVSKVYFSELLCVPTSKANVPDEEAQLRISVKKCSEMTCCHPFVVSSALNEQKGASHLGFGFKEANAFVVHADHHFAVQVTANTLAWRIESAAIVTPAFDRVQVVLLCVLLTLSNETFVSF